MKRISVCFLSCVLLLGGCSLPFSEMKERIMPDHAAEQAAQTEATAPADAATPTPAPKPASVLAGRVIVIDPGHGLNSSTKMEAIAPNASETKRAFVSGAAGKNQTEEELNLAVCLMLRDALTALGARVHMTRETHETTRSNIDRALFANELGADISVKIHADGNSSSAVSGASILIPGSTYLKDEAMLAESRRAAEYILSEYVKSTGAKDCGVLVRNDMTGFNWSTVPVVLLEMGFLSNPEEDALMETVAYREKIVQGIVSGLTAYFETK